MLWAATKLDRFKIVHFILNGVFGYAKRILRRCCKSE